MAERLKITLLGGIAVTRGDKPVTGLGTRKAEALLAYLVMQKRPFSREVLADLLWDDRPQEQASANLRSLLSGLRRKLKPYLIITRQTIAFDHSSDYSLDVASYEQLSRIEDSRLGDADHQSLIANLQAAITLYRGDFLAGFHIREAYRFEEWVVLERERLRRLAVRALRQLVDDCLSKGHFPQGIQFADQLLHLDNLSEHAHRQKMLLLARSGQRNAALQQYDACYRVLSEELGVKPAAVTTALFERLSRLSFPPPHNLPPPPTPFVGRDRELVEIHRLLANPTERLITLFGPGGIGKTRLALALARQIIKQQPGQFFDGVFYLPLAAVATAQQLPDQIAHTINFTFQGQEIREVQLVNYLRGKEMLIVLDNFEQFLGADDAGAALIAEILRETAHITMLITSRERLNLYEEAVVEIGGLDVPPDDTETPEQYSAVNLFLQRATRLRHDYAPSPAGLAAIVRSCRLLGGMPLAIELAAGWANQHSFAEIETQIATSFDFLQTTFRNVPSRQRSLRAVFDHSWHLLTPQEQVVFPQLAVFPDNFTLAAARDVIVNLDDDGTIVALTDKSLVAVEPDGRFHVHPILYQYALEKLAANEELETAVSQRHTHFYLHYLAGQSPGESTEQRAAIKQELPNLRATWNWAVRHGDIAAITQATPILNSFFSAESWFQEAIDLFQIALEILTNRKIISNAQSPMFCELYRCKARQHIYIGQLDEARQALDEAVAHLTHVDDPEQKSAVLGNLALTRYYAGDYMGAAQLARESLFLSEGADNQDGIAFAVNFLGSCFKAQGEFEQAAVYFERAVAAYHQLQDGIGEAMALHNLGNLAQAAHDYGRAQTYYRACSKLFKKHDHIHGAATTSANAGRLALQMEDYPEAEKLLTEALTLKEQMNDKRGMAVALVGLGAVAAATDQLESARTWLAQALTLAQQSGDVKLILEGIVETAVLAKKLNQPKTAAQLVTFVLNHPTVNEEVRQQAEKLAGELKFAADPPQQELNDLVTWLLTGLLIAS